MVGKILNSALSSLEVKPEMTSWAGSAASLEQGEKECVEEDMWGSKAKYLLSRDKVMKKGQKGEEAKGAKPVTL